MQYIPPGLMNLGNTCFLNSCIQILKYVDDISPQWILTSNNHDGTIVLKEWLGLREEMKSQNNNQQIINPLEFVKTIHSVAHKKRQVLFTGWAQNDLSEFLLFMIDCMHDEMKRPVKMNISGNIENATDNLAFKCYSMLKENYEKGDYSELSTLFNGIYVSRLSMTRGGEESQKPEQFTILDLPLPQRRCGITLLDCLNEFVKKEVLTDWINETTKIAEPAEKDIVFWSFPQILIITLKRFSADGRKNDALVDFPVDSILDLSDYSVGYKPKSNKYRLFGVANHMGDVGGGHYTSYARSPDSEEWFLYNDSQVFHVSNIQEIVSPSAYCLWFRKV